MAYCTENDVAIAAGGHDSLVELCDLAGERDPLARPLVMPAAGLVVLAQAIADADALIDSYVAKQRAVPLSPVPSIVRRMSIQEAVFQLRSGRRDVGEFDRLKHEDNVRWLEGVARGTITLGVDPQPAKSALVAPAVVLRGDGDREVTAGSLRGLW